MANLFKLISLNVRGLNNFQKRRTLFTWCRKRKADVIFFQETHSKKETEKQWTNEWGGKMFVSHGSPNSCGVAVFIRNGFDCSIQKTIIDPMGRFIILKMNIEDKMYTLINIYAPNKDRDATKFFKSLYELLQKEDLDSEENIIIGGDFNCPLNILLDKRGGILIPRKMVIDNIECLQSKLDLVDIWRIKNPQLKSYTWSQKSPEVFCRLDYWLISNNLQDFVKSTDIIPAIKTDHAAIDLVIADIESNVKGPGFWKMNVSLLEDEEYINELKSNMVEWKTTGKNELSDKRCIWDWIKYKIRAHCIAYSKKKNKEKIQKEKSLQNKYEKLKIAYENNPTVVNFEQLNEVKETLEWFYEQKTKGIIIRARGRWHEHGERNSKYFLNLEKRNQVKKHIRKLVLNGSITTNPFDILNEQKRFYSDLYQSKTSDENKESVNAFLNELNIPKLSEEQKQSCEGEISLEECKDVLDSFQNNKSPGNDGLPIEFYKTCWDLISDSFIDCVKETYKYGEMSSSQRKAVITLIEKKDKDRTFIENWRPISLINVDAKIISKVIALRIKEVLPYIIHHNQTGYIKDRYIGETIRSIFDLMDYTDKEDIPGILIFIDFQKAFDSLEWNYLFCCLEAFNFGPMFIHWVETFYQNIQSCVTCINNGLASDYFTLGRGVRQGDPLSPYLFVLAVETLAISIRENAEIKGIKIKQEETKLLQYADDTTVVLSDVNSARILFQQLEIFNSLSGLAVNSSKTEGFWIGSLKDNDLKPFGIKWPIEPIKALGVFFTYDKKLLYEKNFKNKVDKMKKLVNIWSSRGLSIYGRVTIIKSLLIPKLIYVSSLMPTPSHIIKEVNQIIYKFLWKGTDKVTRLSAINKFEEGGLEMIDLETMIKALRLAWLSRIFSDGEGTWKTYLKHLFQDSGELLIFSCNYDMKDLSITSLFYQELLQWWSDFREYFAEQRNWQYIVWNNKEIRVDNKPVFYKRFFDSDIYTINDLLFDLTNSESFNVVVNKIKKLNFITWTGLRLSIPSNLKGKNLNGLSVEDPSFIYNGKLFDLKEKKSKHFYSLLISKKAKPPTAVSKLKTEFHLSEDELKTAFTLPHNVALEPYVKAFQFKILNSILFTNTKLFKIGYILILISAPFVRLM